jgi:hypothetical protein
MRIVLIIISCFIMGTGKAQYFEQIKKYTATQPKSRLDSSINFLTNKLGVELHYLYPLYQSFGWADKFNVAGKERAYNENLSHYLSFAGDYKAALHYSQLNYDTLPANIIKQIKEEVLQLKTLQYADARQYILAMAAQTSVVMINEAHQKPQHRAFTYSLLESMYQLGYRYLAMEALSNYDTLKITQPDISSGHFIAEPVAAEMVRKAIELGFTLVAYEDTAAYRHSGSQRDAVQAANINRVLQQDPSAKIIVHAGYAHIAEMGFSTGYTPMGAAFKKLSGIDPLTIDQTDLTEGSSFEYGRLYYNELMRQFPINYPAIALQKNKPINLLEGEGYDLSVIHPPTQYTNQRPQWLSLNGERKETVVQPTERLLFFVQAYYANEYNDTTLNQKIPADQTYITADNGYYSLYLKKGNYKLVLRDVSYKILAVKDWLVQ